ncbi:MAG: hypothetical protein ACI4EV_07550 [Lachnospiraceae bacterium]
MNRKNFLLVLLGTFFVLVQFNLRIGNVTIDIFHDVLGFILIVAGAAGMAGNSKFFKKTRNYAIGGIVAAGLVQWFNTMDFSEYANEAAAVKVGLIAFFFIYVTYYFTEGIIEYAKMDNNLALTRNFRMGWLVFAGTYFLYFLALMSGVANLSLIVNIVVYVAGLYHIFNMYNSTKTLF